VADRILEALRASPDGMDREALVHLFGRNLPAARLDQPLALLLSARRARVERDASTGGRPRQVWRAV